MIIQKVKVVFIACIFCTIYCEEALSLIFGWMPWDDVLKICSRNIDDLDLLPTVLNQKGWQEIKDSDVLTSHSYVYDEKYVGYAYKISFGSYPDVNRCIVTITSNVLPEDNLKTIFDIFKPADDFVYFCRAYDGRYPTKIIEWKSGKDLYLNYFSIFNLVTMKHSLSIQLDKSKSDDYKYVSICKEHKL